MKKKTSVKTFRLVVRRDYHKTAEVEVKATSIKEAKQKLFFGHEGIAQLSDALYDANFDGGDDTLESIEEVVKL